jgi:hypothetical protein
MFREGISTNAFVGCSLGAAGPLLLDRLALKAASPGRSWQGV